MRRFMPLILILFMAGCATLGSTQTPSYHTKINREDSEIAWSRAYAYLARRFMRRSIFPDSSTMLKSTGEYVIEAGNVVVTREIEKNYVKIRITVPVNVRKDLNGEISKDSKRELDTTREFIHDMLRYITSGNSRFMDDEETDKK